MELKSLDFEARKRNAWQVFDLSLLAVHRWGSRMFVLWFLQALLIFVPTTFLFDSVIALLVVWWLKPVLERPLLHFASQAAFGVKPGIRECLKVIPALGLSKIILILTLRRFSPQRAFVAPVDQLEGLKGSARAARIAVLKRLTDSNYRQTLWFVFCFHAELIFTTALLIAVFALIPGNEGLEFDTDLLFLYEDSIDLVDVLTTLIGYGLIAPYYVTGGFLAYLHSRIDIEAWDIELAFKRMAKRLLPMASLWLYYVLASGAFENPAYALPLTGTDPDLVESQIEQIYQNPEVVKISESWKPVLPESDSTDDFPLEWLFHFLRWFFNVFNADFTWLAALYWGAIVVVLGALLWKLLRIPKGPKVAVAVRRDPVQQMPQFIREANKSDIPTDLLAAAKKANAAGDSRAAMAWLLMYALVYAHNHYGAPLGASMTENECIRALEKTLPTETFNIYRQLFNLWMAKAWAHREIQADVIDRLLADFANLPEESQRVCPT